MRSSKEYRDLAASALKGNYGTAIGIMLVYALISSALTTVGLGIGLLILGGAFTIGLTAAYMGLFRSGGMNFADLFYGFTGKINFGSTIGLGFFTALFTMLWSFLFIIPGIIATYSYSMAPYIMIDHPEMKGLEAITASKNLMKGKKVRLFCLELSYIGWILLGILTCGILLIWVEPKMLAARAAFYEDIKQEVPGTSAASTYTDKTYADEETF